MARGWESKSVEAQQEEAGRTGVKRPEPGVAEEEWEAQRKRRVLALARARVTADLERSKAPAQRTMLERALADLAREIESLG